MFAQLMTGGGSPKALLTGLGSAVGAGHLRLWSAHPAEQARLATLPIAGELTSTPGPYAQLVVNNAAGGKLDYYLGRTLTYTAGPCTTGLRDSTITVTLTNGAPTSGLSAYALTRADKPAHAYPPGQNRTLVSVYAALGARLRLGDPGRQTGRDAGDHRARTSALLALRRARPGEQRNAGAPSGGADRGRWRNCARFNHLSSHK